MSKSKVVPMGSLCLALLCAWMAVGLSADPSRACAYQPSDLDRTFSVGNITPRGEYYQARVPDTLDLSERAKLAVHALAIRSIGGRT